MKRLFLVSRENPKWEFVLAALSGHIRDFTNSGAVAAVTVQEPTRSLEQNARLWAMLTEVAEQVDWPVDGRMQKLSPEDWKAILSAGLKREQRVAQGVDGGFVLLGQRTSRMTKREMSDLMELIAAFGAEHGVTFTEAG